MSRFVPLSEMVLSDCKGITPQYVEESKTIVLNQKCVHDFMLDYSLAQFVSDDQKISENKYVQLNDILINSTGQGTAGRCTIVSYIPEGYKITVDSHMLIVRCNNIEDVYLLAYHLYQNEKFIMSMLAGSSGQGELDKVRLFKLKVPMPEDKAAKEKIAEFIHKIGNSIEINETVQRDIDTTIALLYKFWFVQYDFPDEKGRAYYQNDGEMEWNDSLKRNIPKGWTAITLEEISQIVTDSITPDPKIVYEHYSIPAYDDSKYPVFDQGSSIDSNKYIVPLNGILVSKLNPQFKRLWDPINFGPECICSTEFMPFVANDSNLRGFLYALLDSEEYQKYMIQCSSSSTGSRKRMAPELCGRFSFAVPKDRGILYGFSSMIDKMLALAKQKRVERKTLLEIREYVFPLLMTEQIKI